MIAIVDYGVGNLFSLAASFRKIGAETCVTGDREVLHAADHIVLPGVGAFGDAAEKLRTAGLDRAVKEEAAKGKPLLGICLDMQLLFGQSLEFGLHRGLGLLPGTVVPISDVCPPSYKIPHIGWNALRIRKPSPLFSHIHDGESVYFVHSYFAADCEEVLLADTEYGACLTAAVGRDNIFGCQCHPEKSGEVGLNLLRGFCEYPSSTENSL